MLKMDLNFNVWMEVLTNPKGTFSAQKAKADLGTAVVLFAIAFFIFGFLTGLGQMLGPQIPEAPAVGIVEVIMGSFGSLIGGIIGMFIAVGIVWVIAKVLGGKGSYTQQFHLTAVYLPPITILSGLITLIALLSGVGAIGLLGLLVFLYSLYLLTLMLMEAHEFGMGKAILTWIIPAILVIVIIVVLAATVLASIFAALGSGGFAGFPTPAA